MTTPNEVKAMLSDMNPDALYVEELQAALVGIAQRCGQPTLAVYSMERCIAIFEADGMSRTEAVDYLENNVVGAWMGENTPIWMTP